ncbi:MAG: hypothetical protein K9N09_07660 [Candidatus Cloacimonetes bacterium]|nr:hypothetical protein [Candidatus Cloacimonadota bacterium]MCF7815077.1 hypothetical protein [Candidatus Cloacimonadota bacterium]MCF7868558.1 hypothetical protein [Candidatus Cloacimonadota bacterium]MCF7884270.1 hypothetical protein [Candidatus Cloacimonadota bacterium]
MATHKPVEVEEILGKLEISSDRKWLVVRTKPRREKKLADFAGKAAIDYYLPLKDSEKIYDNRKIVFTKPLFPGYVFVHCNFDEKRKLILTGHTAHFLRVRNEQELIEELNQIYLGKKQGAKYKNVPFLSEGTKVKITGGPFEGLTGFVVDQNNIEEVVLQVKLLREAVAVSVDSDHIKVTR